MEENNPLLGNPTELLDKIAGIQALAPEIPSGEPTTVKAAEVAGTFQSGPEPNKKEGLYSTRSLVEQAGSYFDQAASWARNPDDYGRATTYGAGIYGANFERYYNHPKFKELGFNPTANNDIHYNENSSWWDDFLRMSTSFVPLFAKSFQSPYTSGQTQAKAFERAIAIGGSTRGGLAEFFTNLGLNSAFTLGITAEMLAENFAIGAITELTGGATGGLLAANIVKDIGVIGKLAEVAKATRTLSSEVKSLNEVNKARDYWTKTWNVFNPLRRSEEYVVGVTTGAKGFKDLNSFAKTRKAFGAFYRDVRELNATYRESMMEGASTENDWNRDLVDKFYDEHHRMPNNEEAKEIYDKSKSVGAAVSMANMPAIYFTNKLIFDNVFNGFRSPKIIGKELIKDATKDLTKKAGWQVGENVYNFVDKNAKNKVLRTLIESPYIPISKKYILGNFSEGIQELTQDIISDAAKEYHTEIYRDPAMAGFYSIMASVGSGTGNAFSSQGLETFMSGFLMGSVVQGVGRVATSPKWLQATYKKYKNSEEYKTLQKYQSERENLIANTANSVLKNPLLYFSDNVEHAVRLKKIGDRIDQAQENGNEKEFIDAKDELSYEHLYNLARINKMDLITEHLDSFQQLSDKELTEAFNEKESKAPQLRESLTKASEKAQTFQKSYDFYSEKFENPFSMKDEKQQPAFIGFETAKKDIILSHALVERTLERRTSLYNDLTTSVPIKDTDASNITSLLDSKSLDSEILVTLNEAKMLNEGTADQKKEASKKFKKIELLNDFRTTLAEYYEILKSEKGNKDRSLIEKQNKLLYDVYTKYLKFLGKSANDPFLTDKKIQDSFVKVRDYFSLTQESVDLSNALNHLMDPGTLMKYSKLITDAYEEVKKNIVPLLTEATVKLDSTLADNSFLQALFNLKVTVGADQAKKIVKDKDFTDVVFYDSSTEKPIEKDDPRYAKIQEEVDNYLAIKEVITGEPAVAPVVEAQVKQTPVSKVEKPVPPANTPKELLPLYEQVLEVTPDEKKYKGVLEGSTTFGQFFNRISQLKGSSFSNTEDSKRYQTRGNIIDEALRLFLSTDNPFQNSEDLAAHVLKVLKINKDKAGYDIYFTNSAITQLFKAFTEIKQDLVDNGFNIYSSIPTLWGTINGKPYAGTMDLLAEKDGKYYIIDLKTSKYNRRDNYENSFAKADKIQLNGYVKLIEQQTSLNIAGIFIYPLEVNAIGVKKITSVKVNKALETRTINGKDEEIEVKTIKVPLEDIETLIAPEKNAKKINPIFKGKLIYATPGAGKTTFKSNYPDVVDTDDLFIKVLAEKGFTRLENETDQDYIFRYSKESNQAKDELNTIVLAQINTLKEQDKTILTGTLKFIGNADVVITVPKTNKRLINKLGDRLANVKSKEDVAISDAGRTDVIYLENQELEDYLTTGVNETRNYIEIGDEIVDKIIDNITDWSSYAFAIAEVARRLIQGEIHVENSPTIQERIKTKLAEISTRKIDNIKEGIVFKAFSDNIEGFYLTKSVIDGIIKAYPISITQSNKSGYMIDKTKTKSFDKIKHAKDITDVFNPFDEAPKGPAVSDSAVKESDKSIKNADVEDVDPLIDDAKKKDKDSLDDDLTNACE